MDASPHLRRAFLSLLGAAPLAAATGSLPANVSLTAFGAIAAEVVADAIVRAVMTATSVAGWNAVRDL